ncbi:cell envelope integrity TolA C-terminal domain-containing protein [Klebsiella quasipneumoniae]|uniref:cell envelope integrity TolA C-terminal domain-containing protein n=1 Tax=Klebsiella quasipneumoniae TaxID=1463165 RepID=UPI00311D5D24
MGVSVRHIFKPISYLEIQLLSGVSGGYISKAAISAITRAKIPAAPDNETYQRVKNAALDFRL